MKKQLDIVLGLQWGDEGKGKIVDSLAGRYPAVARFQGGPNAGHSLQFNGNNFVAKSLPSGIFRDGCVNIIGNGVVLDPQAFMKECKEAAKLGVDARERVLIPRGFPAGKTKGPAEAARLSGRSGRVCTRREKVSGSMSSSPAYGTTSS